MYSKINYARLMRIGKNEDNDVVALFYTFVGDEEVCINVSKQISDEKIDVSSDGIISKLLLYSYMQSQFKLIKSTRGRIRIKDLAYILS